MASSVGYDDSLAKVFGAKPDAYMVMEGGFTAGVVTTYADPKIDHSRRRLRSSARRKPTLGTFPALNGSRRHTASTEGGRYEQVTYR